MTRFFLATGLSYNDFDRPELKDFLNVIKAPPQEKAINSSNMTNWIKDRAQQIIKHDQDILRKAQFYSISHDEISNGRKKFFVSKFTVLVDCEKEKKWVFFLFFTNFTFFFSWITPEFLPLPKWHLQEPVNYCQLFHPISTHIVFILIMLQLPSKFVN